MVSDLDLHWSLPDGAALRAHQQCLTAQADALDLLECLVNIESGPGDLNGLQRVVEIVAPRWEALDFSMEILRTLGGLPMIVGDRRRSAEAPTVVLLGHLDTVFSSGTSSQRPFRQQDDRVHGPGVADMKGGIVSALMATASAIAVTDGLDGINLRVMINTDEESGSVQSRALIEDRASPADLALVFEPGRPDGSVVIGRRGVLRYRITVEGKAAHTGVEPWAGVNAIESLARKVVAIQDLDQGESLSVTVATINGGSGINIVPEFAEAEVDVRVTHAEGIEAIQEDIDAIIHREDVAGSKARHTIFADRPPMEPHPAVLRLIDRLRPVTAEIGFPLSATSTGGASDGCFTSAMGIPTLDGLGPVGGGYHTDREYFVTQSLTERSAMSGVIIAGLDRARASRD